MPTDTLDIGGTARDQGLPGAQNYVPGAEGAGFGAFLSGTLSGVMVIAALLVLLYLIWGAIEWITSGGDKAKTEKARNRMTQSVIGLIVLASVTAIFMVLQSFLGVNFFNFGGGNGGGSNLGGSGGSNNSGNCVVNGQILNDGGAGGYCTNGGAARVKCFGPGQGPSGYSYNHFEPCSCVSGQPRAGITLAGC